MPYYIMATEPRPEYEGAKRHFPWLYDQEYMWDTVLLSEGVEKREFEHPQRSPLMGHGYTDMIHPHDGSRSTAWVYLKLSNGDLLVGPAHRWFNK